jgi:hypothetical protein
VSGSRNRRLIDKPNRRYDYLPDFPETMPNRDRVDNVLLQCETDSAPKLGNCPAFARSFLLKGSNHSETYSCCCLNVTEKAPQMSYIFFTL